MIKVQIMNNIGTSKGYVMVYEGKLFPLYNENNKTINPRRGEAKAHFQTIKNHMKFRMFDSKRILFINSGLRNNFITELWLVPNNATPPQSSSTIKKMNYRRSKAADICGAI